MYEIRKPILDVLTKREPKRMPIWLMRQAGRYLPEYRALRTKAGSFLALCYNPEWAAEITLQPLRRFDLDAAIIFADILIVPNALGLHLEFREGEGPVLQAVKNQNDIENLKYNSVVASPVFETVRRVKKILAPEKTLIGFCGAPWTVACYMIGGTSRNGFTEAKLWVNEKPALLGRLIDKLVDSSFDYLCSQVEAGAEVLQIFDSWGGLLSGADFGRWVIDPTKKLVGMLKNKYPDVPIIGFPREAKPEDYLSYAKQVGVNGLSLDTDLDSEFARRELQPLVSLQGNLDPALLVRGGLEMKRAAEKIIKTFGKTHIFNLGHGVVPETPPEHVTELVNIVHGSGGN
jgi:uroporphyrinogen decarboxylase